MAKTKVKAIKKLDNKTVLLMAAAAAMLGFLVYKSYAAIPNEFGEGDEGPKPVLAYTYKSNGIKHDRGTAEEDPDWAFKVWRAEPGLGFAWKGPRVEQRAGTYKACFYTEKEAGGEDNSIAYSVVSGDKVLASYEGPTSYDWERKRYWRDCLIYRLKKTTGQIQFRANPKNGTFDIAKVEIFKGSATPPNSNILNEFSEPDAN